MTIKKSWLSAIVIIFIAAVLTVAVAKAATNIGDNISTDGTISANNFLGTWQGLTTTGLPYLSNSLTHGYIFAGNSANAAAATSTVFIKNGNVGIGTTNPLAPLQIGNGTINNSVNSQVLVSRLVDDTIVGNAHAFSDSSNITRSGVIGYNSYDARVNFSGTANYDHYAAFQAAPVYNSAGTMNNAYGLYQQLTAPDGWITNSYGVFIANSTGYIINKYALVTDTAAGNVGIGTTSPSQLLTVGAHNNFTVSSAGDVTIAGANQPTNSAFNTYGNLFVSSNDASAINKGGAISLGGYSATNQIYTFARIQGKKETTGGDGSALGYLAFETDNNNNLVEHLRITSAGNVGIGTNAPGGALEVASSADNFPGGYSNNLKISAPNWPSIWLNRTYDGQGFIMAQDANGYNFNSVSGGVAIPRLIIQYGGNLGIGTTMPVSILHVAAQTGTSTVTIGALNTTPACLKMVDVGKTAYTYCTFSAGTMTCSTNDCSN